MELAGLGVVEEVGGGDAERFDGVEEGLGVGGLVEDEGADVSTAGAVEPGLMMAGFFGEQVDGLRNIWRHARGPPARGRGGNGGDDLPLCTGGSIFGIC